MVVVGGARLLQHLSTELNLRQPGLFTTVLLRLKADSQTSHSHMADYPCKAPLLFADFVDFVSDFVGFWSDITLPIQHALIHSVQILSEVVRKSDGICRK